MLHKKIAAIVFTAVLATGFLTTASATEEWNLHSIAAFYVSECGTDDIGAVITTGSTHYYFVLSDDMVTAARVAVINQAIESGKQIQVYHDNASTDDCGGMSLLLRVCLVN